MNYKKIVLVTVLLLAILTLGVVSATDDADALATSDEGDIVESPIDESEVIALDGESDVVGDDDGKSNVTMDVHLPDEIYLGDEIYMSVSVYGDDEYGNYPTGDVVLYVNDEEVARDDVEGNSFEYKFEDFGVHNFKVEYGGDENFNGAVQEFTCNLSNTQYHISINERIYYGVEDFDVYAPVLNPNDIIITINGKKFNVTCKYYEDYDGDDYRVLIRCNASELRYGLNTVHIYYPGDEKFAEYSDYENITVFTGLGDYDEYLTWGEPIDVSLTLPSYATGTLEAYYMEYDDEEYWIPTTKIVSANLVEGSAKLTLSDLKVGRYNVYLNFTGSVEVESGRIYVYVNPLVTAPHAILTGEEAYVSFEASKDSVSHIEVVYRDWYSEYDEELEPLGNADVVDGKAKVSLSSLDEGFYQIEVRYYLTGDEDYLSEWRYVYVVDEYNVTLTIINCQDVLIGGSLMDFERELPGYADGNISYYIDGNDVSTSLIEGYGLVVRLPDLSIGEHTFEIRFTSTVQGNASDSVKFNMGPARIYIPDRVDVNDMHGSAGAISVEVYENATGTITVLVDNKEYAVAGVDAKSDERPYYYFHLNGISLGKHNVSVIYRDDKYPAVSRTEEVSFGYAINIDVDESYGNENTMTVYVPKDLGNGDLTITVDGKAFKGEMNSNIIKVNLSKLSLGKHVAVVKYSGDDFYPAGIFNQTFELYAEIRMSSYNVFAGSDEGITLMLPEDAKGKLNVTVEVYKEFEDEFDTYSEWVAYDSKLVSFVNGKAYYSFADLPAGEYRFTAKYTGDDYKVSPLSDGFMINLVDWGKSYPNLGENVTLRFISIFTDPGQLRVVLSKIVDDSKDWDDPVNVAETLILPIENGKVTHTFTNLAIGNYHIFIAEEFVNGSLKGYQGGHYFDVDAPYVEGDSGDFSLGAIPAMSIDLPADANGTIKVIVYENYTKEVSDIYKEIDIPVKGDVSIDLSSIITEEGRFKVSVIYDGNYGQFRDEGWIYKISENKKENPNIEVATQNVTIGDVVTVDVTVPIDASGKIIATVEGMDYEAKAIGGKAKISIPNLKSGNHNIVVTFAGDSKYNTQTKTLPVTVFKKQSVITVKCDDAIVEGDVLAVEVSVAGATGKVKVNGIESVLTDGKAIVEISALSLGKNTINAVYDGDDAYEGSSISIVVTVNLKGDVSLKASASDIKKGQVATINIELNSLATGQVTVNAEKVAVKDGKATFSISNLPIGNYNYLIKFTGDENFVASNTTVSFKVDADPAINAANAAALYTAKNKYSVTVYGTDEKPTVETQVIFKVNGKQVAKTTTNSKGVATYTVVQVPGSYKITAEALGVSVTKKLTVKHVVTLKTVTVKKSAKKLVLQVTLAKVNSKYLKNKQVTFKFNGKTYKTKTTSKGVAKVTITSNVLNKLKVGKKVTYQATYLKDTVKKTVTVKK